MNLILNLGLMALTFLMGIFAIVMYFVGFPFWTELFNLIMTVAVLVNFGLLSYKHYIKKE